MGAWGFAALDNDPALDVLDRWQRWVEGGYGHEEATDLFFRYWGDAVNYGDSITNMEIIALLAIHLNSGIPVPKRLVKAAAASINRELVEEELASWSEPEKRKEALLQLLAAIGGKVKPPKPPKVFNHPAIHFKKRGEARAELLKLGQMLMTKQYPGGFLGMMYDDSAPVPPFLRTLNRLMYSLIWEADFKIHYQAWQERQMMLVWYQWLTTRACNDPELTALVEMLDAVSRAWPDQ